MLDVNEDRAPINAGAEQSQQTNAALRAAKIASAIRRNRTHLRHLGMAISLIIVSTSLFIFVRTIIRVDPRQLEAAFAATGLDQIALAFALAALSYLALTGYDGLALRHLRIKVPYRLTATPRSRATRFRSRWAFR